MLDVSRYCLMQGIKGDVIKGHCSTIKSLRIIQSRVSILLLTLSLGRRGLVLWQERRSSIGNGFATKHQT